MNPTSGARTWRPAAALLLAAAWWGLAPSAASGQERPGGPTHGNDVHGVVRARDTGAPLPGSLVRLVELRRMEITHDDGTFHLENVPAGEYTLVVERLGYRTETVAVDVSEAAAHVEVLLAASAIELAGIVVTGTPAARAREDALRPVDVVSGRELARRLEGTIAQTLEAQPGLASTSMGPATARPVIRGMSGDRVLMLEDGERVNDLSAASSDHATAVDPLAAQRIEIVRGPGALLYGSNALGGVINVIREEVPTSIPDRPTGRALLQAQSVNSGVVGGGSVLFALGPALAVRTEASARRAGDLKTPAGVLQNTDLATYNLSAGGGWVGDGSHAGASYRYYHNDYGIPGGFVGAHPQGVEIRMRRHAAKLDAELVPGPGPLTSLAVTGGWSWYTHREIEAGGILGTAFRRAAASGEVLARHGELGVFSSGAAGARFQWDDYGFGGSLGTGPTRYYSLAGFLLEELDLEPFRLEVGARYDWHRADPERERTSPTIGRIRSRSFGSLSGSVGALYRVAGGVRLGASVARAFRVPDVQELYSEGPHLAAYSFEVGNPDLDVEVGTGWDGFVRVERPVFQAEVAVFRNRLGGYIYPRETGDTSRVGLPIYQFAGEDALLRGIEGTAEWDFRDGLVAQGTLSYVRGSLLDTGDALPLVPPLKGRLSLRYETAAYFTGAEVEAADRQDRVGEFETPTAGYVVLNLGAGYRTVIGGRLNDLTVRITNLTDREYRNHLSRTKEILPEAGRGLSLLYSVTF